MSSEVIVSVDCSNRWTCVGLAVDGAPLGEKNLFLERAQAGRLPIVTAGLLSEFSLKVHDITCLAVAVGPGYFTGIRIGMAYAAGLAFALGVGIVPLSSLQITLRSCPQWNRGLKIPLVAASRELAFSSFWLDGRQILPEAERSREEIERAAAEISSEYQMCAVDDVRLFASSSRDGVSFVKCPSGAASALMAWDLREHRVKPDALRAEYMREPGLGNT